MKNLLMATLIAFTFLGCNSKEADPKDLEAKLVIQQSLETMVLNDQFDTKHKLSADTKTLVFAFSKDVGHTCNDFFATKADSYLADHKAVFVADVSGAPSVIRSMFIMPGLKDFKHTVLVIDDKNIATGYRVGINAEKIIVVSLDNNIITAVEEVNSVEALATKIELN